MFTVDRIEEGIAVLISDSGERMEKKISELPDGVKEGCILRVSGDSFIIDKYAENERRQEITKLMKKLFKKK